MGRAYWLFKTEPSEFSLGDLAAQPAGTAGWDGVRNYQARNLLRDQVRRGDGVLVYHSGIREPAAVGTARVVEEAQPDPTQFDPTSPGYDPRSNRQQPRWVMVKIRYERHLERPVTLAEMRAVPALRDLALWSRPRLSVVPLTERHWHAILALAGQ
jgi:predicted RNA-binding protein with PUA-like domain